MAKYSVEFPREAIAAMQSDLGEDGADLQPRDVVVAFIQQHLSTPMRRLERQAVDMDALTSGRAEAEATLAGITVAQAEAQAAADAKADLDVQAVK